MEGTGWYPALQAPQRERPGERGHEHEGGRRNTDQVVQKLGTMPGRGAPAWEVGDEGPWEAEEIDCTSHNGLLLRIIWSHGPKA